MPQPVSAAVLLFVSACASTVPIATFDGAKATTLAWQTVNDPVMGGKSESTLKVDAARHLGVWNGEVKIVPFLKAPGFCNLQSPGMGKSVDFPDLSGASGITLRAREALASGLLHFNVQFMSKGAKLFYKQGVYMAAVNLTGEMADHFVPWSAFKCTWRGKKVPWCPKISTQLDKIQNVGLGTFFPGTAGKFDVEIQSLSATSSPLNNAAELAPLEDAASYIDLATFDEKAPHKWHSENDPVMGGQSSSSVEISQGRADFNGSTRIVPKLKAPGFTIAMTEGFPLLSKFPDASSMDGLTISARQMASNYSGYKIAFCDSHLNFYRCQMESFKADLPVPTSTNGEFQDVFIPWSKFSDKWNPATGKHTADNPPQADSLKTITQLQIWTEAVEGDFHLQFQYIRASKAPSASPLLLV